MIMDNFSYECESGYGRFGGEEAARNFRAPIEVEPEVGGDETELPDEEKREILSGRYPIY